MDPLDRWLDATLEEPQKRLVQIGRRLARAASATGRGVSQGDLPVVRDALRQAESVSEDLPTVVRSMQAQVEQYDVQQFLRERFEGDLRAACQDAGLALEGTFPTFVVPPVRVRVDARSGRVRVNRISLRGVRVQRVVEAIKRERERITQRPFNAKEFLRELAAVYDDLVALESAKQQVALNDIERSLKHTYARLVPRREWRAQYPEAFFAYDLHRLLASGELRLADGRRYYLGPSRNARENISILDRDGRREVQYGVIAFRRD